MDIFTTEFHPRVNNIRERILIDDNLQNLACLCHDWADFVTEISEWGIYKLGGVDFDTLTKEDISRLDQFMKDQNGYIKDEEV